MEGLVAGDRRFLGVAMLALGLGCVFFGIGATRQVGSANGFAVIRLGPEGIVRQRAANDCGVAALAMLLRLSGIDVRADDLFESTVVPVDGLSLLQMSTLAAAHGMRLAPAALPRRAYADVPVPWVAHLSWDHYVVVEAVAGGRVVVADPRAGRLSYAAAAFVRAWSGYALIPSRQGAVRPEITAHSRGLRVSAASGWRADRRQAPHRLLTREAPRRASRRQHPVPPA